MSVDSDAVRHEHGSVQPGPHELPTVVIPARDEERHLSSCLDSVLGQSVRDLEIIVVDNGSEDGTGEIARAYADRDPRVRLIRLSEGSIPAALNAALEVARGQWFIRVDAHTTIPPDYVELAVRHLRTGRWGGIGGRKDGVGDGATGRAIAAALSSRFGVGNSYYHYGREPRAVDHVPYGAYPTGLLRALGGWNERLLANEDFELDFRLRQAGYRLLFDPAMRVAWRSKQSFRGLFRQYRRYGRGKADVALLHPRSLAFRHLVAPGLIASWAGALAAFRWWPRASALSLTVYPAALAAGSLSVARGIRDPRAAIRLPLAFAAMHVGWGLGFWEGILTHLADPARKRRTKGS